MAAVYKSLTKTAAPKDRDDAQPDGGRKNKVNNNRVLILSSRGVTFRQRHLLNDLADLMPHARKDVKFDSKNNLQGLCELAHLYNTNNVTYFLSRKTDLYMYFAKVPNGPTVKMLAENIHTTDDLNMPGNCLKGSRPILSFDSAFEKEPHLKLIKELFTHTFGVPPGARKSKPFIDRVMSFSLADGKIWVRNYEIREVEKTKDSEKEETSASSKKKVGNRDTDVSMVEIGPRFVLTPILIQEGALGGPVIYQNRRYVSPNQVRSDIRKAKAGRHNLRVDKQQERLSRKEKLGFLANGNKKAIKDSLDSRELFA